MALQWPEGAERALSHLKPKMTIVKSLFILWITGPRSSVRPSLTRAWWLSATGYVAALELPPGRGDRQWLKVSVPDWAVT